MKVIKHIQFKVISLIVLLTSCLNSSDKKGVIEPKTELKDITSIETVLPYAEGSDQFKANCMTCHSLAYIEMQPDFPRKNWEKIVDKMIKNFGAPIADSTAAKIVDYLVAIKGKK